MTGDNYGGTPNSGGLKRQILEAAVIPVTVVVVGAIASVVGKLAAELIAVLLVPAIASCAIFYVARVATHWELGYWRWWRGAWRWAVSLLLGVEMLIAIAFLVAGPALLITARHGPVVESQLEMTAGLFFVILIHSLLMSAAVELAECDRGSENAEHCWIVKRLNWVANRLSLGWLMEFFLRKTSPKAVSFIVITILAVLLSVVATDALLLARDDGSASVSTTGANTGGAKSIKKDGSSAGSEGSRTHPRSRTSSTEQPEAPKQSPLYSSICHGPGTATEFGEAVPEPQRQALDDQWFLKGSGLGGIYAGCFHEAERVGKTDIWVAAGTCRSKLRSLALAQPDGSGAIVLYRAAELASREAETGTLRGETSHDYEHQGDMYTVTTTKGTTVFLHNEIGGREPEAESSQEPQSCTAVGEGAPLIEVPSGLTWLWVRAMEAHHEEWLRPTKISNGWPARFTFRSENPLRPLEIYAECQNATTCTLHDGRSTQRTPPDAAVSLETLLTLAGTIPA